MPITLGLSILVSGAFGSVQVAQVPQTPVQHIQKQTNTSQRALVAGAVMASAPDENVHEAVQEYFADIPIMIAIANCESKFHQYDLTGGILTSVTGDLGVMQINAYTHGAAAETMGLDLNNIQDNMAYARYLYKQAGTAPWNSSSRCWAPQRTVARTQNAVADQSIALQTKVQ